MKVPISWLKEYVSVDMSAAELADIITNAGLEVETIEYVGIEGADLVWDREKVLLAQVVKVEQHPDADKLVLATCEYGGGEPKVVVTGAPNLMQFIGEGDLTERQLYSPIIFEGATYLNPYKDGKPAVLKGKALRGIYNDSMLCSAVELGVGEDHDGIILMEKTALSPDYVAGTPLQDVLGDAILEIAIIPNIARCASVVGVAREVAALTDKPMRYPSYDVVVEGERDANELVKITTEAPDLNPRFVAMVIEGVSQTASPYWMQQRLTMAGMRPINVVVDVSNYVMLEMGQPNHAFDMAFLRKRADQYDAEGPVHIVTRLAEDGETLTTLDGKVHQLLPNNILVADPVGNLSLGGIMGGFDSEIQPETKDVLLEAAAWNFINIRQSGRQLGIHTDAGFRFSRGVHPSQAILGARRAAELLRVLAGGTVQKGIIDHYPQPPETIVIDLDPTYVTRRSGLANLTQDEMAEMLKRLEFGVQEIESGLRVTVPDHRIDLDGQHDLLEEICRMYRYEKIPSTLLADTLPPQRGNRELEAEMQIKDTLVDLGLYETITYRLTTATAEAKALVGTPDDRPYITLTNPSTQDRVSMRHSLLASVLDIAAENSRFQDRIALFEVGNIFLKREGELLADELPKLALVMTGKRNQSVRDTETPDSIDFFDVKGVLDRLFADLGISVQYKADEHPTFRPGRTAKIYIGETEKNVGVIGELHPLVKQNYGFQGDAGVIASELDLTILIDAIPEIRMIEPLPTHPAVKEDLALVVDAGTEAGRVERAIYKAGGFLLKNVELFDIYEGDKIPVGKKSLAYHLTFQSPHKTLKDKDVQKLRKKILGQLRATINATLRE